MADGPARRAASSAWNDLVEPQPSPPPPKRRLPSWLRPGPLGLLIWILVGATAGAAAGVAWHASIEEVVTLPAGAVSTLAPGLDSDARRAWAITQVAGITRADGATLGEWLKAYVDDQRCQSGVASDWIWVAHEDGLPTGLTWRVGLRRVSADGATCNAAWDRFWVGQVAASDGVVQEVVCTIDLVPRCPDRLQDGPLPTEPVNAVVDWLDEFTNTAA